MATEGQLIPIAKANQPELSGISRSKVYQLIDAGELQQVKIGTWSFLTRDSVDAYIARLIRAVS